MAPFTEEVERLRIALDIPRELSMSIAIEKMAEMMGVSVHDADGRRMPLPVLVREIMALMEGGVEVCASEEEQHARDEGGSSAGPSQSLSAAPKEKKQGVYRV